MAINRATHLGDYFSSSRIKGDESLPLLSVTLNNGLVKRDSLERRTETNIEADAHLLVREGDIAYNMMRVWQGALGRAECDGLVSPAYVVVRPKKNVDGLFASYLFKTPRMIYLFWAYSYGLTKDRLRLYANDFKRIPAQMPEYQEQKRIAQILATWDKAITTTEKLLANSQLQKKALMQQLLSGKKRFFGHNGKWEKSHFSDLVTLGKERIESTRDSSSYAINCIELEHIEQGTGRLTGLEGSSMSISTKSIFKKGDVLFGKLRPYLRKYWLSNADGICSTEIWVFKVKRKIVSPEFVFQLVQTSSFIRIANVASGTHMPRADWNLVRDSIIRLPTPKEQEKISAVLICVDREADIFKKRLDALKKEKEALMHQLLTGNARLKTNEKEYG